MSIYYSRFNLNLHPRTPYFQAHLPYGYELDLIMMKCRSHRRLPPNLKLLSGLSKQWGIKNWNWSNDPNSADGWYDSENYELNPDTGKRLSDKEINAQWKDNPNLDSFVIADVPIPMSGFADPMTWEEPIEESVIDDDEDRPTQAQLLKDIASHGREATAKEYGIPIDQLPK